MRTPRSSAVAGARRAAAWRARVAAAVALLWLAAGPAAAQPPWYELYEEAKQHIARAQKGGAQASAEWAAAENKLNRAKTARGAPAPGRNRLYYGQWRQDFLPDYFLGIVYRNTGRPELAVQSFEVSARVIAEKDKDRPELNRELALAQKAVTDKTGATGLNTAANTNTGAGGGTGTPAGTGTAATTAADARRSFTAAMAQARRSLDSADFAQARASAEAAVRLGVDNAAANALLSDIGRRENFATLLAQAQKALQSRQYAEARRSAGQAAELGVDAPKVREVLADVERHERFDGVLAGAQKALEARQFGEARRLAGAARDLNVNPRRVDDLLGTVDAHERFAAVLADAQKALDGNRFAEARQFLTRARAQNVDPRQVDTLARRADTIEGLTRQIRAAMASNAVADLAGPVEKLEAIHAANAILPEARTVLGAVAGEDQKVRSGLRQFYRGEYAGAIAELAPLGGRARPRADFYLACSKAALALLERDPERRKLLEQEARQHVAPVKDGRAAFAADFRYLSPRILAILGLAGG